MDAVQGYRVLHDDAFPTHQPVQVSLNLKKLKLEQRILRKPQSASDAFEATIAEKLEEDKKNNENDVRKAEKAKLHEAMDKQVGRRKHRLEYAVHEGDTAKLWDLIAAAMEGGFIDHFGLEGKEASKMKGRNAVSVKTQSKEVRTKEVNEDSKKASGDGGNYKGWNRRAGKHTTQANRLINVARRMQAGGGIGEAERRKLNQELNLKTWEAYIKEAKAMGYDKENGKEGHPHNKEEDDEEKVCDDEWMDGGKQILEEVRRTNIRCTIQAAKILRLAEKHKLIADK